MENNNLDKEALISIYKNARIALQSISDIIGETDDETMREELRSEYEDYEKFLSDLSDFFNKTGIEPQDVNFMQKAFMYTSVKMNTLTDDSASRIAELMLKGTITGITELAELLNAHGDELGSKAREFAERLKDLEETFEERLKKLV